MQTSHLYTFICRNRVIISFLQNLVHSAQLYESSILLSISNLDLYLDASSAISLYPLSILSYSNFISPLSKLKINELKLFNITL